MTAITPVQMSQIQEQNAQKTVFKSSRLTKTVPFENQSPFKSFNWQNFAKLDIVWLEDNREVDTHAGVFLGFKDGNEAQPLVKLMGKADSIEVINLGADNISCLEDFKWVKYKQ